MSLPAGFYRWARWYLGRGEYKGHARDPKLRPHFEYPVRRATWAEFRRRFQPKPPTPARLKSAFSGVGMFTVERPEECDGLKLDYVLRIVNPFMWTASGIVVCQDESHEQYLHALAFRENKLLGGGAADAEWALVTTLDPAYHPPGSWPDGWTMLVECYWNVDGGRPDVGRSIPNMLYEAHKLFGPKWGTVPIVLVLGCYDASGENPGVGIRLDLPDYMPDINWAMASYPCVVGYCIWRIEATGERTLAALAAFAEIETALRRELWLNHGHSSAALYGDDGEMQCAECPFDFRRESIEDTRRHARIVRAGKRGAT